MSPELKAPVKINSMIEFTPPPPEQLTPEAFWERWGEVSGLTFEHFSLMWERSAERISGHDFEYHNLEHPREMLWVAMSWADFFEAGGFIVNRKVLIGADMYHDDGYHEDHKALGYESKEELAADRFAIDAPNLDYNEEEIELGKDVIITTRRKEIPRTIEGVIMLLSDIWNVGADYQHDFQPKTDAFAAETKRKVEANGGQFSLSDFQAVSIEVLCDYIIALKDQKICPVDKFIKPAVRNLRRRLRETAKLDGLTLGQYFAKLNNPLVTELLGYRIPRQVKPID